ncbi:exonuclease domain-containing protein [Mollicutes bacterium LVI A0039]|nr:exonuclease domain-containing protein [Mollicutes bacterium LVI A0039]
MFTNKAKEATFVVFDLETTGFSPVNDQIIEIGAVKVDSEGVVISRFSKFVKLYKVAKLSPKIKELTQITDNMLELQGEDVHEVMDEFCNFIGDAVLVAQNAKFDISFMAGYFIEFHKLTYSRLCFDTIKFAKVLMPNEDSYRLTVLAPMFGVEYDANAHHRADYDAEITAKIFAKQLASLNITETTTILDMINLEASELITSKQESFLNSLMQKHGIRSNQMEFFNKQTASAHIDIILNSGK